MNSHESIRMILSLAAAGALDQQDVRKIEEHTRVCPECRRELEDWSFYAAELRKLPQPTAPADLIERTQARILREHGDAAASRWNALTLGSLAVFSWVANFAFWMLARVLSGGRLEVLGTNLVSAGPWFLLSFAVASITAASTALLLGNRRVTGRML